jgi:hypothetical protein
MKSPSKNKQAEEKSATHGRVGFVALMGRPNVGKSTLLGNFITSDMAVPGRPLILIDPKGDLVADVLARVPDHRRGDVIILDPADSHAVGLNPLATSGGVSAEVAVENLVGIFRSLYRSSWGPRTDDIMRAALLTLALTGDFTLAEVPLILSNASFRRRLVGKLDDPIGLGSFWGWWEALSPAEQSSIVAAPMNKIRAYTMRPTVRAIIGQAHPKLSMPDVLGSGKILLVSLASGLLGEEAANLLGALVMSSLWHATKARAGLPPADRRPAFCFIDEFQNVVKLPTPLASILAEARGLGLGLHLEKQRAVAGERDEIGRERHG